MDGGRSLELNLTSHQRLIQYAVPYLEAGIDPAIADYCLEECAGTWPAPTPIR
ncbi:MAG: hypothetical protein R2867_33905 [Caldilineaceae bacterium]